MSAPWADEPEPVQRVCGSHAEALLAFDTADFSPDQMSRLGAVVEELASLKRELLG